MPAKRLLFTLLYDSGSFMLSRNFRLQRVGNLKWLEENYGFSRVGLSIDGLVVLDVSRQARNLEKFCEELQLLTLGCFAPITAGGGIKTIEHARALLRSGADKIVINTMLHEQPHLVHDIASEFGAQCITASIDCEIIEGAFQVAKKNGFEPTGKSLKKFLGECSALPIGEIYLNSITRDGTSNGLHLEMLEHIGPLATIPLILAGGIGHVTHIIEGLKDPRVDAVATANLLNFMGDGLALARKEAIRHKIDLPQF